LREETEETWENMKKKIKNFLKTQIRWFLKAMKLLKNAGPNPGEATHPTLTAIFTKGRLPNGRRTSKLSCALGVFEKKSQRPEPARQEAPTSPALRQRPPDGCASVGPQEMAVLFSQSHNMVTKHCISGFARTAMAVTDGTNDKGQPNSDGPYSYIQPREDCVPPLKPWLSSHTYFPTLALPGNGTTVHS
jgi:hypothetical protein